MNAFTPFANMFKESGPDSTTLTATPLAPVTVYYCKAGIQTGRTIRVLQSGTVHETAAVTLKDAVQLKSFVSEFRATMSHDNSKGKPKASGARCVLVMTSGQIQFTT